MEELPWDKYGNLCIDIIVNHAHCEAGTEKTAVFTTTAVFQFMCSYKLFDVLITDPGSDFKSEVTKWFDMEHIFSLVDRHESCGIKGTGKQVARHVRELT